MAIALTAPWATQTGTPQDRPFALERIPGGVVAHRTWREAHDGILTGLAAGHRVIVLLGDPGAGKTLMLEEIESELAAQGRGIRLIDDADRLPPSMLMGVGRRADYAWLITGQRGFANHARLWGGAAHIVWLQPMPPDEVARFVASRLRVADRPRTMFEPEAVLELARRSEGLPRRVLVLAGDALRQCEALGDTCVTSAHVRAAAERRILPHPALRLVASTEPVVLPTPVVSPQRSRRPQRPVRLKHAAGYALAFTAGGAAFVAAMLGLS